MLARLVIAGCPTLISAVLTAPAYVSDCSTAEVQFLKEAT